MDFSNFYENETRAKAYANLEFDNDYYLGNVTRGLYLLLQHSGLFSLELNDFKHFDGGNCNPCDPLPFPTIYIHEC